MTGSYQSVPYQPVNPSPINPSPLIAYFPMHVKMRMQLPTGKDREI
jgi:hypothetical protein